MVQELLQGAYFIVGETSHCKHIYSILYGRAVETGDLHHLVQELLQGADPNMRKCFQIRGVGFLGKFNNSSKKVRRAEMIEVPRI
jgi:hypothetical protein